MSETTTRASLDLLYNVSRELTSDLDLRTVLARALSLSSQALGAERASIIVVNDHQQPVEAAIIVEGRLLPHTLDMLRGTLENGLAGWVFRSRQPALILDSSRDQRWQQRPDDAVERSGAKSALCVPVIARDQVVGVITLVHPTPNFFNPEHLALLGAIADQAGIAIFNARLHGELQAAHRRYQELFEDSINPICISAWNGVILETNRQMKLLSGYDSTHPLRGSQVTELVNLEASWLKDHEPELRQGRMVQTEAKMVALSGQAIPVEAYVRRVTIDGEEALQWILRDITERKALDSLRETLTASIVHDLRAPLSNIISSLDFLNIALPPDESTSLREVLAIASRSSARLFRLITSLLDIDRLEKGQKITALDVTQPAVLVSDALDAVRPNVEGKRQILEINLADDLPELEVDADMILRVIINLLDNAVKYTPIEGRISLAVYPAGEEVLFRVQDSGPGIPSTEKEAVFNKFYRLQSEHKKTGFGLGLAFCKLAVEAHGGRIWVENAAGAGCAFSFTLPAHPHPGD